jgi:PTH1 family peptidyl-tRNA hydrolase
MLDLVVFLGNPGRDYQQNRHNVAWLFAERLPFYASLYWRKKFKGLYAGVESNIARGAFPAGELPVGVPGNLPAGDLPAGGLAAGNPGGLLPALPDLPPRTLHFLKPETFMNVSGEAAAAAAAFLKIDIESILVVHDELELPLGTVSLKHGGGLGGHNGLRSMNDSLGGAAFWRFRFGIGRPDSRAPGQGGPPGSGKGVVEWVLSDFSADEGAVLDRVFAASAGVFTAALLGDPAALLPAWGKKRLV